MVLRSTDFGKFGLNEAGFKALSIASIIPLLNEEELESLHSEAYIEGGYADLIVLLGPLKTVLSIKLKYLQLL
jgi:hypothetical protein